MKIGLVGYQGSGKTTLFEWLTGAPADPSQAHTGQSAMAAVPDDWVQPLCDIYRPKKITLASLELVDTPGLARTHEGNAARLAIIREAGCLVLVVAGFGGADPLADLRTFREDCLLADLEIILGRIERLRESLKKPRPNREKEQEELDALLSVQEAIEAGKPLAAAAMNEAQLRATRSFRLLSEKPTLVIVNAADDQTEADRLPEGFPDDVPTMMVRVGLERELERLSPEDRAEFQREMGLEASAKTAVLRKILEVSGQMLYYTAGEKEVRTWMLRRGGTALEAAGNIHTDLARGFIRAETMSCADLVRLGGERELKAQNLLRHEPKDYVVRDGDILNIRFSV